MNTQTTYHLTLRRRYNDRQSVLTRKVSLDDMDELWLQDFTLTKWEYAYILSNPEPQDQTNEETDLPTKGTQ